MLSLRRSMREMDESEAAHRAAAKAFAEAAETAAQHVVEVDADEAHRFRKQVLSLAGRLGEQPGPEELSAARRLFQSELRGYAERAGVDIRRLKNELGAAAQAMQSFAQGITTGGSEHEAVLNREFQTLTHAAHAANDAPEVRTLRAAIHETVANVSASYQELKQSHNLVIAQLRDEIRVLQQAMNTERKPVPEPELVEKHALDRHIEEMLRRRQPFHVMLIGLANFPGKNVPQAVQNRVMQDFLKNLQTLSQASTDSLARFSTKLYAVMVTTGAAPEPFTWQQHLSACHLFQDGGIPRTLRVEPRVSGIEYTPADSPMLFFARLSAATEDLERNSETLPATPSSSAR